MLAPRLFLITLVLCCVARLSANDGVQSTSLFDAIDAGQLGVTFIAADANRANVIMENLSDQVLMVELPDAIAAVPVLAQLGPGFGQNAGQNGGQNGGGGAQTVGGNLNGGGNGPGQGFGQGLGNNDVGGRGANGFGQGFMRIPPNKTRKLTATTVCLEYGKPEPRPRMDYRLVRIGEVSGDERVAQLCRQIGTPELSQQAAQAVAWHLASGLSWDELARINRIESPYVGQLKYFQGEVLDQAKQWVDSVTAPASPDQSSPR